MGSFLVSCGLTNQTIRESEEVVWIPILLMKDRTVDYIDPNTNEVLQYTSHQEVCYKTDRYKPLGFVMTGKLRDCGYINFDYQDQNNILMFKQFIRYLKQNFIQVTKEYCHKHSRKVFDINNKEYQENFELFYEDLMEYNHRIPILVQNRFQEPSEIYFYVVKKSAYKLLIDFYQQQQLHEHNTFLTYSSYKKDPDWIYEQELKISSLKNQFNVLIELYKEYNDLFDKEKSENTRIKFLQKKHKIEDIILRPNSGIETITDYYLYNILGEFPLEEYYPYFETVVHLKQYLHGLDICNSSPKPVEYANQDYQNLAGLKFAEFIEKISLESLKFSYNRYVDYGDYDETLEEGHEDALKSFEDFCKDLKQYWPD